SRAADFLRACCFDPAGEQVVGSRSDRDLRGPAHVTALLGGDFHTAIAAVPDVSDRKFAAAAVRYRPPAGRFAIALLLERRIWKEVLQRIRRRSNRRG